MNVEFIDKEAGNGKAIVVNGEIVGNVEPSELTGWFHAVIYLPVTSGIRSDGLIQGFGVTRENAVFNAIEEGYRVTADLLAEISLFKSKLFPFAKRIESPLTFGL